MQFVDAELPIYHGIDHLYTHGKETKDRITIDDAVLGRTMRVQ